jgi:hypothetical protein
MRKADDHPPVLPNILSIAPEGAKGVRLGKEMQ